MNLSNISNNLYIKVKFKLPIYVCDRNTSNPSIHHYTIVAHVFFQLRFSKLLLSNWLPVGMGAAAHPCPRVVQSRCRALVLVQICARAIVATRAGARVVFDGTGASVVLHQPECVCVLSRWRGPASCRACVSSSFEKIGEVLCVDENYFSRRP